MSKSKMTMDLVLLAVDKTEGKKQRRLFFKRKRGGKVLTREQVAAIKTGRKLIRKELKERGIKGKGDFELMASSMGLYFDKMRFLLLLRGLLHGRGLAALLAALAALLVALFLYSAVTQLRGHFTINMSAGMFREGFVLSETVDFEKPTTHLFSAPAENVPCISISHIPADVGQIDGSHNDTYFAYTYYVRNEGESTVGYDWELNLNSESLHISDATWVMVFEDDEMTFYAKPNEEGNPEALPAFGDNSRGYVGAPLIEYSRDPAGQYNLIAHRGNLTFYRLIPKNFVDEHVVARGTVDEVEPQEVHKYTIVIWLEGDDPQCTDELIGGHVGMEVNMMLVSEESSSDDALTTWQSRWDAFWDNLKFWKG